MRGLPSLSSVQLPIRQDWASGCREELHQALEILLSPELPTHPQLHHKLPSLRASPIPIAALDERPDGRLLSVSVYSPSRSDILICSHTGQSSTASLGEFAYVA